MKFLIDAGHGGMLLGHYLTAGKRSPAIPPGIYEGDFNRRVAEIIALKMDNAVAMNVGPHDIPLLTRVGSINKVIARGEDVVSVSIHANAAAGTGWSNASGFRVFYSYAIWKPDRRAKSKRLAEIISESLRKNDKIPYGGRSPLQAKFAMLAKPKCPAVLVECGFMTNIHDATFMASDEGQYEIAMSICDGLEEYMEAIK